VFSSADNPARTAMMITLVSRETFTAANALRTLMQQIALVIGPSIAGLLLSVGLPAAYWTDAATFGVAMVALATIDRRVPEGGGTRFGFTSIIEGLRFLRGRQAMQGCFVADLNATILGIPNSLFPAIALHHLHGGPQTLGLLYTAPGVGAITTVVLSGWTAHVRRSGRAVLVAVAIWGLAICAFGTTSRLAAALVFLAVAGGANVVSAVFRNTIIQAEAPDRLRGRLTSLQSSVVQSGPLIGNAEAGATASLMGTQLAVVAGGLASVAGICIVAALMPGFRRYELRSAEFVEP
jgi:MFS family permease